MHAMIALTMPWWEFVVRGAVSYLGLLVLLRLTGRHTFGEMSPFDIIVLILVGGVLRSAIVGNDNSLTGAFIAISTILALDKLLGMLAARSAPAAHLLEGQPLLLVRHGRVIDVALRRASLSQEDLLRELRMHEVETLDEVREARLETTGRISVLRMPGRPRPL